MKIVVSGLLIASLAVPAFAQESSKAFDEAAWSAEFKSADKDGDGKLNKDEALAANPKLGEHFKTIDANGDGFITPDEDKAMLIKRL
ncbi:TPA: hypothetical protein ACWS6R_000095 [Klebsiella pneumoniae]|uniref:hypothetical protein n=1 Tax=Klebsiella sp. GG_Kp140 TaxID=3153451 RepID=UPI0032B4D375|nr:hypothetical protein [Klebsiella pneumoniae]